MIRAGAAVLSFVLFVAAPAFAQTNVTGDWDITIQSPQGTNTVKMSLKQEAEKVSGLFKSPMGELPFTGTVTGEELKFAFSIPFQGQPIDITMTGKVEAESMAGTASFGGMVEGPWSAKRSPKTDAAVAAPPVAPAAAPAASDAAAPAVKAAGEWDVMIRTPGGEVPASVTLAEEDSKLTGTLRRTDGNPMGPVEVSGTREGKALKLSFTAQTPQGSLPVTMTGDIDGDSIVNGKAEIGGMGTMEWTAKRKP